jgi:threonylcarbamoyladenosine tRNA methylthiotransferase MtaB
MKISLETLGCKLNQAETEVLARQFVAAGHQLAGRVEDADIYILNTCTVTGTADSKSRQLLRKARRQNPRALIVVTGCYSDRAPLELAKLEEVNLVTGNDGKGALLERLEEAHLVRPTSQSGAALPDDTVATTSPSGGDNAASVETPRSTRISGAPTGLRTRASIKIQDGCRNFCAYCIVPYVRRVEKSVPPDEVLAQVKQRVAEGYQEVVLTGTRIGAYECGGLTLKDLVGRILDETKIGRVRLSSIQPRELSPGLLALWKDRRLCPHFHLSLQSGSNTVLARMRRRYTTTEFEQAVGWIRAMAPGVAITTDVIVGFPGETDTEFAESLEFCRRMEFARIHVFPFSARSGTEAAQMAAQVPANIKKERARQMLALAEESASRFREQFAGAEVDVLWEKQTGQGVWSGVTGNYLRVFKKDRKNLGNTVSKVKLG